VVTFVVGTISWLVPFALGAAALAVAAVFRPLRRRVQGVADRRFNRRRHDAGRNVDAFSARLRDQLDLDALHGELLAVVDQTHGPDPGLAVAAPLSRGA
jgi:hypothetical protein